MCPPLDTSDAELSATADTAGFTSAFLALTVICVLATLAAAWLRHSELQQHQIPTALERMGIS